MSAFADVVRHGRASWRTILRKPLYPGSVVYMPTLGPVTSEEQGFEGPAEWLREQGYDVTSWRAGPHDGFRAELRRM